MAGLAGGLVYKDDPPDKTLVPGKNRKLPLVKVEKARRGEIARTLEATGDVVAINTVAVKAAKEGPIAFCPWRAGDEVAAGQKLVEIDRPVQRAEAEAARAALEVARAKLADLKAGARPEEIARAEANVKKWQATLDEAARDYRRKSALLDQNSVPQQAVDQARERVKVAEAELAAAQAALRMLRAGPTTTGIAVQEAAVAEEAAKLDLARAHLAECVIAAPFDAVVTRVHVRPGDLAAPRETLIEIFDPDSLVVRFSVAERYAVALRPGLPVEARLDAIPGKTFRGRVDRVYPQLDPAMRTRTVEAAFENPAHLMPHQFARLTVELKTVREAVIVPAAAILESPDGSSVAFVIEAGKAVRRIVQVGIEQGRRVQVLQGIEAGEQVVVVGNENLKDGAPVRVAGVRQGDRQPDQGPSGGGDKGGGSRP